jgi:tetratricopeptide (TPR) repeat protein
MGIFKRIFGIDGKDDHPNEELQERMESRSSESFGNGGKRIKGNPVEEWVKKGGTLVTSGRYEEAIECCDMVLEIDPSVGPVWYNKGVALTRLKRSEEALQCYDKALEIDPMVAVVWYHKMDALVNLKRYEEAQICIDKVRELDPDLEMGEKSQCPQKRS